MTINDMNYGCISCLTRIGVRAGEEKYKTLYLRIPCLYLYDKNEYYHFKRIIDDVYKAINDNNTFSMIYH